MNTESSTGKSATTTTGSNSNIRGGNPSLSPPMSSSSSSNTNQSQMTDQHKFLAVSGNGQVAEMVKQSQNQVLKVESMKSTCPKSSQRLQDKQRIVTSSASSPVNPNTNVSNTAKIQNGMFATPAITAQQFLKGQMGIKVQSNGICYQGGNNNNNNLAANPGIFNPLAPTQTAGIQPTSFGMDLNEQNNQYAALLYMLKQSYQLSTTQSQVAQAAAILSASGFGNNMMNGQSQSTPDSTSLAAAHAFVMMLNQQHLLGSQAQSQHLMNNDGNSHLNGQQQQDVSMPSTLQRTSNVSQTSKQGDDDKKEFASNVHKTSKNCVSSTSSTINKGEEGKLSQQQKDSSYIISDNNKSSCDDLSSTLLNALKHPRQNMKTSTMTHPQMNQMSLHSLPMPMASMQVSQAVPSQHVPLKIANSNNTNCIIQPTLSPLVLSQMQTWSLNKLENHVQLLLGANQPIPHAVQILLAEARKIEQKRAAKRIANRKSACTSRARKKALVEEMTNTNAKLRRQAIILSLLPDLVIAIKEDGTITFCSAQVERVLRHKVDDLIGANIDEVLMPSSRVDLASLVEKLVMAEKAVKGKGGDESGRSSNSGNIFEPAVVSEQSDSFPLSVVKVKSHNREGGRNSALNCSRNEAADTAMPRVATQSSLTITNQSNSDNSLNRVGNSISTASGANDARTQRGNGVSDLDSSSSSEPKNLTNANEALNRNVRFHNEQLKIKDTKKTSLSHKDDVTGDSVTANNADARLSSLMMVGLENVKEMVALGKNKSARERLEALEDNSSSSSTDSLLAGVEDRQKKRKRQETSASDDSGYRESGESDPSREDSASSTSDASNGRPRPLAPTCNICMIRADLSTIWCEVTSSIRTRSINEEQFDMSTVATSTSSKKKCQYSEVNSDDQTSTNCSTEDQIKELLLCLRPIQDGTEKVSADLRFIPKSRKYSQCVSTPHRFTEDTYTRNNKIDEKKQEYDDSNNVEDGNTRKRPKPKNEESFDESMTDAIKKQQIERKDEEAEKTVVESLIMMSSN